MRFLLFLSFLVTFLSIQIPADAQSCEAYSAFSASLGICLCELGGGNLRIPQLKCCDSVVNFLRTGCDGEADPERVARILDPRDRTLFTCAARDCVPYNGNGGDLCVKAGARMRVPCCSSVSRSLAELCAPPLDPVKVEKMTNPADVTLYYCGADPATCHAYEGDGGDICVLAGGRPRPRPPCCASVYAAAAALCAGVDPVRLVERAEPGAGALLGCRADACEAYAGDGAALCAAAGGTVRPPCCASVAAYLAAECVGPDPDLAALTVDPTNTSLFACAGAGADCMPYHPLAEAVAAGAGAAGAAATAAAAARVDACRLAGGARKRPCCRSVRNWISTGCYSVDSILQSRVTDPWDSALYTCGSETVRDDCYEYNGNGRELCALVGGAARLPCCSSVAAYIAAACDAASPDAVARLVRPGGSALFPCSDDAAACYPYRGGGGVDLCALARGRARRPCCGAAAAFAERNCSGVEPARLEQATSGDACAARPACFDPWALRSGLALAAAVPTKGVAVNASAGAANASAGAGERSAAAAAAAKAKHTAAAATARRPAAALVLAAAAAVAARLRTLLSLPF